MQLEAAIDLVKHRFVYQADQLRVFDSWRVMKLQDGRYRGDCEDFALTVYWHVCDHDAVKFLWNLLVTHRYGLIRTRTARGEAHVVGAFQDQWFDNFTKQSQSKENFFQTTGHHSTLRYPGPLIALYLLIGLFVR